MADETFRIRIKRDGTIYFLSRQLGDERMRLLREMLEDALGEITEIRAASGDEAPPSGVHMVDEDVLKLEHGGD